MDIIPNLPETSDSECERWYQITSIGSNSKANEPQYAHRLSLVD